MKTLSPTQIEQLGKFSECIVMHPQLITIFNDFDELRFNVSVTPTTHSNPN